MYGMLLESVQHFVQLEYGEEVWKKTLHLSECKHIVFNTHTVYPDNIISDLASALAQITAQSYDNCMIFFGRCFVRFFSNFGYDRTIKSTGRNFTEFLENVDNIHMQFILSYPKMKSPSMYVTEVDENGCVLVYRSARQGFTHYIMGQLYQIAEESFDLKLETTVLNEENKTIGGRKMTIVHFRLNFDNSRYILAKKSETAASLQSRQLPPFKSSLLFELFPFAILFNSMMEIVGCGEKLIQVIGGGENKFLRQSVTKYFRLRRPKGITFSWKNVINLKAVMFELELLRTLFSDTNKLTAEKPANAREIEIDGKSISPYALRRDSQPGLKNILLTGQMRYLEDIQEVIYLCSPVLNDINELPDQGLYLTDLNQHGLGKEMILAGWQHNSRLRLVRNDMIDMAQAVASRFFDEDRKCSFVFDVTCHEHGEMKLDELDNENPNVYNKTEDRQATAEEEDDDITDNFDSREIFDLIRNINDPEHPLTLEELHVVQEDLILVDNVENKIKVCFTPTIPHCSMATLIGLSIRVKLLRCLPPRFKVNVEVTAGTHNAEQAVNKQLADKERVAAALENEYLIKVINQCIANRKRA